MIILSLQSCNNDSYDKIDAKAMVVSAHPLASDVGIAVLKKGGNAADATIAVQFALAVVYPSAGNIGGGGFFVYRSNKGNYSTLDYREKAPLIAYRDMYLDSNNKVIKNSSLYSHKAVGVPGSVDGMVEIHQKYGNLKWEELVQPSINLAENGFVVTSRESKKLNRFNANHNDSDFYNPYYKDQFKDGDTIKLPDLAQTLKFIRDYKREGFYSGKVAENLITEMKNNEGFITENDLKSYKSIWREPIIGNYKNYKLISMGPPSSGGVLLMQMLKMAEQFPLKKYKFHSKESIHIMTEIERRSFADRAKHFGDPDFYDIPISELLDSSYLQNRANNIDINIATPSDNIYAGSWNASESDETTHFSIVDQYGNASSVTTTLNGSFGSGIVVKNSGFLLNNQMDDFSIKPGHPNMYGLIGGEANSIIPEKRMLSSMTPTILEKNGQLFMIVGTPGGSTIISAVFQVILNVIEYGMSIEESVNASRFHHQWYPDEIKLEKVISKDSSLIRELQSLNHRLNFVNSMNRVDAILIENYQLFGGADNRGDDHISFF